MRWPRKSFVLSISMVCIMLLPKVLRHLEHKADRRESSVLIEIADDDSAKHLAHVPDAGGRGCSVAGRGVEGVD
jgi:hypothetical protein